MKTKAGKWKQHVLLAGMIAASLWGCSKRLTYESGIVYRDPKITTQQMGETACNTQDVCTSLYDVQVQYVTSHEVKVYFDIQVPVADNEIQIDRITGEMKIDDSNSVVSTTEFERGKPAPLKPGGAISVAVGIDVPEPGVLPEYMEGANRAFSLYAQTAYTGTGQAENSFSMDVAITIKYDPATQLFHILEIEDTKREV